MEKKLTSLHVPGTLKSSNHHKLKSANRSDDSLTRTSTEEGVSSTSSTLIPSKSKSGHSVEVDVGESKSETGSHAPPSRGRHHRHQNTTQEHFYPGQKFKNVGREKWAHEADSTFSLIAFAVDTANLSRFPFFCFTFGGSAFLIPYFLFLIFSAFPLLYMELLLGQFLQEGFISVWKIVPIFRGVGYCICTILLLVFSYYSTPLVWSMIFIWESISSIGKPLPWTTCDNPWNTINCIPLDSTLLDSHPLANHSSHNNSHIDDDEVDEDHVHPGGEFFKGRVLRYYESQYSDPDLIMNKTFGNKTYGFTSDAGMGNHPLLDLSLCLLFINVSLILLLRSSIRVRGKFAWVTSIIPLLVLVVLLLKSLTISGAVEGVEALLTPNWVHLFNPETWAVASIQTFYSTGVGFGVHLTHASHNHFHHNVFWDAIAIAVIDTATSIIGALVIFTYLGHLALTQNKKVEQVVSYGIDLLFESYPDAVGLLLTGARLTAIMFYTMSFFIGFDSTLAALQAVATGFRDEFPTLFRRGSLIFIFAIVALANVFNLTNLTRGGVWMYNFMDNCAAGESLTMAVFIQTIVVTWIWGLDELCDAAIAMTGRTPGLYLRLCWKYISPLSLIMVCVLSAKFSQPIEYDKQEIPAVGYTIANAVTYLPFISIPIYFLYQLKFYEKGRDFKERVRLLFSPENEHERILARGNAGSRFTSKHILFLGGWNYSPPMRVSPEQFTIKVTTQQSPTSSMLTTESDHSSTTNE